MRLRFLLLLVLATPVFADTEYYLPIAGSVGNFRTDVHMFNASTTADVTISVYFLPAGNQNNGVALQEPADVTIPKGTDMAFDDIVTTLLHKTGIGTIVVDASDTLFITTRIYAATPAGTLGQGYRASRISQLMLDGSLIQLRSDASFRTNIGVVNLQNALAQVTWTLYDKDNQKVSEKTMTLEPFAVISPTSISSGFFFDAGTADLSSAHVTFHSDSPIDAYASVIDNATTDPTYFPAMAASGF